MDKTIMNLLVHLVDKKIIGKLLVYMIEQYFLLKV